MYETRSRLKAIWHCLLGHKLCYRATPRVVVKPNDQEMFMAIMTNRLRLVDASPVFQTGTFKLPKGTFSVGNPIILADGASIVGSGQDNTVIGNSLSGISLEANPEILKKLEEQ